MIIFDQQDKNVIYKKAKVLVLSRTKMGYSNVCIGAISENGTHMRLLLPGDTKMRSNIDININDYLIIKYLDPIKIIPPHVEDISIYYAKKISTNNIPLIKYLKSTNVKIWEGTPESLYDNKLVWPIKNFSPSKGYISENNVPEHSVGFWIPGKDMYLSNGRYEYITDNIKYSIKYVGVNEPFECIYKGMLVRVSLARWWKGEFFNDYRCYLQISEFYPLENEDNILYKIKEAINSKNMLNITYFINGKYQIFDNVKPYRLLYMNDNYYLACEVPTDYHFTLFRVAKIRSVIQTNTNFNFNKNILEFTKYIQTPFSKYSANFKNELIPIELEIDKSKVPYFEIKNFLPSQKIIDRKENGNIILSYVVTQEIEIEELIKKWIPYIKIIKPTSLELKIKNDLIEWINKL
jgi:hypothetical protein